MYKRLSGNMDPMHAQRCGLLSLSLLILFSLVLAGCATKRHGRAQPLSSFEGQEYTCRDIQVELAKVDAFEDQIRRESGFDGRSVLGFLGDFGIGNAMERNDAEESARVRKEQLHTLQRSKDCYSTRPASAPN